MLKTSWNIESTGAPGLFGTTRTLKNNRKNFLAIILLLGRPGAKVLDKGADGEYIGSVYSSVTDSEPEE